MEWIEWIENSIGLLFLVCYAYQIFYMGEVLVRKPRQVPRSKKLHRYAFVVSARNEEGVIGGLLDSLFGQDYPRNLLDVFVVADNCTDQTARVCRGKGAHVYERFNKTQVGKGYALDYLFNHMKQDGLFDQYDAFIIFDADNIVDPGYLRAMNDTFDAGYRVITSYRNSKNYDSNWISAGYSLWFLREAKFLNQARMNLGTGCGVSGTGFLVHHDIIQQMKGWKYHLLTEDIEFSVDCAIQGEKIGYCREAMFYDEQPVTFKQSWTQRLRWAKGYYQVLGKYGGGMVRGIFQKRSFTCYDMLMNLFPALVLMLIGLGCSGAQVINAILVGTVPEMIQHVLAFVLNIFRQLYGFMFVMGTLTVITEWKNIHCSAGRKIWSCFTFPLFMVTYVPISIHALFAKVSWQPIHHSINRTAEQIQKVA
ncbi:MAG: glycosyltransferase [Firmicutes bacterium]|nr:glycosyltransferase [Bacillota bacterium]